MQNSVDIILCHCQEDSPSQLDLGSLSEKLAKNKKIGNVHIVMHLCSIAGMKEFAEIVQNSESDGLVLGACAAETLWRRLSLCLREADTGKQPWVTVPLRELLWSYRGKYPLQFARDLIKIAVSKVRKSADNLGTAVTSATIDYLKCNKCKRCMEECPIGAYSLNTEGYPKADPELCQYCGICVGSCPVQCISLPDLRIEELCSEIRAIKGDGSAEPTLLAFCCEPLTYPGLMREISLGTSLPSNMRIIRVPCMGAVNTALINDALTSSIDGVLLLGCERGSCQIRQGNILAKKRLENLKETLGRMMLETERVQYLGWPKKKNAGVIVDTRLCNGCLICREVCPFDAVIPIRKLVAGKERLVSERDAEACRSCGICAANCPSGACQPVHSSDLELVNVIDALCSNAVNTSGSDAIVLCNCDGKLEQYIDFSQVEKALNEKGFSQVHVHPRLCREQAWQEVKDRLTAYPLRGVVAACAKDFFGLRMQKYQKDAGIEPGQWSSVDLWEKAMLCLDRSEATDRCVQDVLAGLAGSAGLHGCGGLPSLAGSASLNGQSGSGIPEDREETLLQQEMVAYAETLRSLGSNPLRE